MRNSSPVCCDANLVVRLVTKTDDSAIRPLWRQWRREGRLIVAPRLLRYEVVNAIHRLRLARKLDEETAPAALRAAIALPIQLSEEDDLHQHALDLAFRHNLPASYDAHYLALAERLGSDLWTADERLFNSVRLQLSWVHLAGSSA